MRICEIFRSIQGEGRLTGTESVFVRASGCNLRCRYCDTPYASWMPEGADLSIEEILLRIDELAGSPPSEAVAAALDLLANELPMATEREKKADSKVRHVVITGGEPMLFAELIPLTAALKRQGRHVTIETAGTLYLPVECDLMSISPKLSNSTPPPESDPRWTWRHEMHRNAPDVMRRLMAGYDYQLKFVVGCRADCTEVEEYLATLPDIDRSRAMLMPQGTDPEDLAETARWLEPYCLAHGLHYCPRRHIDWFGSLRGL
ncbi:MAG: 7-carboxy-7-deazaguanine synthase QueE [Planctomycetota bacterium]